jgi:hypothetical protein
MRPYYEMIRVINVASGKSQFRVRFYAQPLPLKLTALAYHHVWERLTEPVVARLERALSARHRRRCHGDCAIGADGEGEPVSMCAYIPLSSQRDLRCFELSQAGRDPLGEVDAAPRLAVVMGWPGETDECELGSVG